MKKNKLPLLALAALLLLCAGRGWAEKADRDKPVNIESDRMDANNAKQVATFDGRVMLTQGTLVIRADRIIVTQDAKGFQTGTATGKPATFRQKRDGFNEYFEGEAERIEYDGKTDRVEFFNNARLKRDCGDDVRGNYISYDARTEMFSVNSGNTAAGKSGDATKASAPVRVVIMPKAEGATPTAPCQPLRTGAQ